MTDNAPGWQADPTGRHDHRYWDGSQWTDNVSDAGIASTDAYAAADADDVVDDSGAGTTADDAAPSDAGWAEPTTTMPAAGLGSDPTAAWPTTPAPPPPPSYTPPPPSGGPIEPPGAGGSRKRLLIGGGILAAVAVVVAAFLLLGGDDESDDVRAQLAAQFRANSELSDSQADCVADAVVDEMGDDAFDDVDFTADEPPAEIADDLFAAAMASLERCDIDPAEFGGTDDTTDEGDGDSDGGDGTYGSDPDLDALYDDCEAGDYQACDDLYNESPSGSEYEEFADTCGGRNEPAGYCVDIYEDGGDDDGSLGTGDLPADFEQQLADVYESSLGLPAEKAECLAGKIAEAVSSGDLTEEQAMGDIFGYFAECDIDMSEVTGN